MGVKEEHERSELTRRPTSHTSFDCLPLTKGGRPLDRSDTLKHRLDLSQEPLHPSNQAIGALEILRLLTAMGTLHCRQWLEAI